jgi:Methyltransferase domain
MKRAIDPIEHIPVAVTGKQWHLSSLVQGRYRTSFDNTNERQYAVVRNIVGSDTAVANLAERVSQIVAQRHRRKPALEWLDVGCESGSNTLVAFEKFRGHDLPVSLTAIEPSPQAEPLPLLQHSVFLNGSEWGLEEFLQVAPHDYKYDIITSVHSWYVIDPIYILSLFRLLQRDGVMAFIISPLENNIINKITIVVDAFIREKHRNREISYSMKKIKDDPYRNFGEDILAACRHYFGDDDDAIKVVKRKDAVIATRRLVTAKGALTSEGKAIAEFFTHGLVRLNDEMCSAVAEVINRSNFNGQLPCTEWDIIIDKEKILTRGQERLFGGIAVPAKSPSIVEPPKIEPVVQLTGAAPTASPPSS